MCTFLWMTSNEIKGLTFLFLSATQLRSWKLWRAKLRWCRLIYCYANTKTSSVSLLWNGKTHFILLEIPTQEVKSTQSVWFQKPISLKWNPWGVKIGGLKKESNFQRVHFVCFAHEMIALSVSFLKESLKWNLQVFHFWKVHWNETLKGLILERFTEMKPWSVPFLKCSHELKCNREKGISCYIYIYIYIYI